MDGRLPGGFQPASQRAPAAYVWSVGVCAISARQIACGPKNMYPSGSRYAVSTNRRVALTAAAAGTEDLRSDTKFGTLRGSTLAGVQFLDFT